MVQVVSLPPEGAGWGAVGDGAVGCVGDGAVGCGFKGTPPQVGGFFSQSICAPEHVYVPEATVQEVVEETDPE